MALQLSTSDYLAIACTGIQVAVTVAIAIWTSYRMSLQEGSLTAFELKSKIFRFALACLRWVAIVFLLCGAYLLWAGATSEEPITKGVFFKTLLYSFWISFNLLAAIILSLVNHFLDRIGRVINLVGALQNHQTEVINVLHESKK